MIAADAAIVVITTTIIYLLTLEMINHKQVGCNEVRHSYPRMNETKEISKLMKHT